LRTTVTEFFAHQLSTDPDIFTRGIEQLEYVTDKKNVLENLFEENQEKVKNILSHLKLTYPTVEELYTEVEKNVQYLDNQIFELLDKPVCTSNEGCANLISSVLALHRDRAGFFLKRKVAEELMRRNPPQNIMKELGYNDVEEMLEREELFEIYAALRFMEDRDWLNNTYIAEYRKLTKDDFESRPIEIRVLEAKKWKRVTDAFLHKKLHPMSHLKELGMIFVVPGEKMRDVLTLYLFGMTSHYLDEVNLYSNYFKYYSEDPSFGEKIVSAIRGDVPAISLSKGDPNKWLVIQRYLFKEDPKDPRLATPHINPEALYHRGSSHTLLKMAKIIPNLDYEIWKHSNYVAVWFPTKDGDQILTNFNLMDNIMSVMNSLHYKDWYNYHFHEALWNKIFMKFFSVEKLETTVVKHLSDGWFDIRKV